MKLQLSALLVPALLISALSFGRPTPTQAPGNPGVVGTYTPQQFAKVYAISDVHGMYDNLLPLLRSAGIIDSAGQWSAGNSLLIVVGDSIDKGPKSLEVMDLWMNLMPQAEAQGGRLVHLLGNHEAEFLADPADDSKAKELIAELHERGMTTDELTNPANPRARFLLSEPVAALVGKWLFCHAGFMEQPSFAAMSAKAMPLLSSGQYSDPFFIGPTSLLEARDWWASGAPTRTQLEGRLNGSGIFGVVFGHQPSALNVQGAIAQSTDFRLIKIDNGMAPQAGSHPGSILVFENPAEMNVLAPPHVSAILSGSPTHQPLKSEVTGPAISAQDD